MTIIPAILPKNKNELVVGLQRLIEAGYAGRIQIDLCDGVFVPSTTWPFSDSNNITEFLEQADQFTIDSEIKELLSHFQVDYDLMVDQAEYLFSVWNLFEPRSIILHLDAIQDEESLAIDLLAKNSPFPFVAEKNITLAISHKTPLDRFSVWYTELGIRSVQVMGIETIGKQGEPFSEKTVSLIQEIQKKYPDVTISVDGGINQNTLLSLVNLNIDSVVAGSAVFQGDIRENLASLQKSAIL